jgi:hypothetical protein
MPAQSTAAERNAALLDIARDVELTGQAIASLVKGDIYTTTELASELRQLEAAAKRLARFVRA